MPATRPFSATGLALIAVFVGIIAALGLVPGIAVPGVAVPITLQTLGVMLAGAVLGPWRGTAAVLVFLLLVALGLPLLAGGRGGLGVFFGPSAGFLIGFPVAAFVIGWLTVRFNAARSLPKGIAVNVLGGIVVLYLFGIVGMSLIGQLPLAKAAAVSVVFLPGDVAKAVVAALVARGVHQAMPGLLPEAAGSERGIGAVGVDQDVITPAALRTAYAAGETIRLATSGTSGRPRWVVRTAASWVDSFSVVAGMCGLSAAAQTWVPGPLEASMNAYAVCLVDHVGATLVDGRGDATHVFCTPAELGRLLDHDHQPVTLVVAGDRLSPALADRAEQAGHTVHHYYGAAQLSFVGWGRDAESLTLFPQVRAEAVDGELWVTSPWLCLREEGAAPVLRVAERDDEIWMSVGDRGSVGVDGRVQVGGRSDAVTTAGATVVLADVETALRPYARGAVVVVGRPHPRLGAVLVAVCTDRRDAEALPAIARHELPASHRPRIWSTVDALPLTAAGKVDRTALVDAEPAP